MCVLVFGIADYNCVCVFYGCMSYCVNVCVFMFVCAFKCKHIMFACMCVCVCAVPCVHVTNQGLCVRGGLDKSATAQSSFTSQTSYSTFHVQMNIRECVYVYCSL